eukprot:403346473
MNTDNEHLLDKEDELPQKSIGTKIFTLEELRSDTTSEIDEELNSQEFKFGFEPKRFLMLGIYTSVLFMNQLAFNTLYYNDPSQSLYMPGIFFLALFTTTTTWIGKQGMYRNTLMAIIIQMFALLFAIKGGSYGRIAGSILNGISMPFLFNQIVTFSASWFGVRGRILSTGTLLLGLNLGYWTAQWAVYNTVSPAYFDDAFLGIGLVNLFLVFIVGFFFHPQPQTCPAKSQTIYKRVEFDYMRDLEIFKEDAPFKKGFAQLSSLLIFTYFSPYSLRWHYAKIIDPRSDIVAIHNVIVPLAQLGGIVASTILLAKFLQFKKQIVFCIWANVLCIIICEIGLLDSSNVLYYIGYISEGFFIGTLQILIYEQVAELSFPISPTISVSCLNLVAMTSVLVLTTISDVINRRNFSSSVINDCFQFIMAGILAFLGVTMWQLEYRLKRIDFDLNDGQHRQ